MECFTCTFISGQTIADAVNENMTANKFYKRQQVVEIFPVVIVITRVVNVEFRMGESI